VLGMFRSLMNLPAGEEVQVLHYLRTNGDVDRLFDDLFSNPQVASQMGQLIDKLKTVLPDAPGIQDLIEDLQQRMSNTQANFDFGKVIQGNSFFFDNPSTNEVTVGPEDVLGEFQQANQSSQTDVIQDGSAFINLERRAEGIQNEVAYLRSELTKPDPDETNMFRSLMNLPAGDEVQVLSSLRSNGDIDRLLNDLFSDPNTASQMGQLADSLQSVVSSYPGIQDIIDEIRSRLS